MSDGDFRELVHESLVNYGRREVTDWAWGRFESTLTFAPSNGDDLSAIVKAVEEAEAELSSPQRIMYLAVPPTAFVPISRALASSGLVGKETKLVIEKPFGVDLESARHLNEALREVFDESQIYRIDHFLGKEGVQNVLALRFANGLFEPAWNADHLDYIQIDVPERLTIEGRGDFYERTGAFRDMVVTHLLQILGFLAMEAPGAFDARSLHKEKLAVFEAIEPLDPRRVVFGQYEGYHSEPGVAPSSRTETFVATEVFVDNARWQGMPFYLRTGKAMAESHQTVTLGFKRPPGDFFPGNPHEVARRRQNELIFELADPGGVTIAISAKRPGPRMVLQPVRCSFAPDADAASHELEAYERLLHDVMLGDPTLFNDSESIEQLWKVAAPVLEHPPEPFVYRQRSWGPEEASELIAPHRWHLPES